MNHITTEFWRVYKHDCGPGSVFGIATGYGLDGPGIESQGGEIFHTCSGRPWGPPSLLHNGYRVFPGGKERRGVTLTPHPLLVPWSRKSRAIPLLPLWAVRPVQSLSACTRVHFTFFCTQYYLFVAFSVETCRNQIFEHIRNILSCYWWSYSLFLIDWTFGCCKGIAGLVVITCIVGGLLC